MSKPASSRPAGLSKRLLSLASRHVSNKGRQNGSQSKRLLQRIPNAKTRAKAFALQQPDCVVVPEQQKNEGGVDALHIWSPTGSSRRRRKKQTPDFYHFWVKVPFASPDSFARSPTTSSSTPMRQPWTSIILTQLFALLSTRKEVYALSRKLLEVFVAKMAMVMKPLGDRGVSHGRSDDNDPVQAHLSSLRAKANKCHEERRDLSRASQEAYQSGDGGRAKQLSNDAKRAAARADEFDKEASEYIFRELNANRPNDEIDLHGLQVDEFERFLTAKMDEERRRGGTHLHVIVGRGNHSVNHVQKLKPAVEKLCSERGLAFKTEANAGRMYVDLTGNQHMPDHAPQPGQGYWQPPGGQQHGGQQGYPGGQQHQQQPHYQQGHQGQQHGGQQHQNKPEDDLVALVKKCLPCCTIM